MQSSSSSVIFGRLGPDELPGTGTVFSYTDESVVDVESGFSRDMIETIFRFTNTSRTLQYGLSKPSGTNTTITGFIPLEQETHTFASSTGMVVAKTTQTGGSGTLSIGAGNETLLIQHVCRQTTSTHNNWAAVGYFWVETGIELTDAEVSQYLGSFVPPCVF